MWSRRDLLRALGALTAVATVGLPESGHASTGPKRLILVQLRGGLDGLYAVPAHGDPAWRAARGSLALPGPGEADGILDLDGHFGLHPALSPLHPWFAEGDLALIHAVAPPNHERSHFEAQDALERGGPDGLHDGWMNRLIARQPHTHGVALGKTLPLVLWGDAPIFSIDPGRRRAAHGDFLEDIAGLWAHDPVLAPALAEARASLDLLPDDAVAPRRGVLPARTVQTLSRICEQPEALCASLDLGGWDTHTNQAGRLGRGLRDVADGLVGLRQALGPAWQQTVVAVVTEFGRTVAPNGTGGTDHGVGGVALLVGGAVRGGTVHADWPGLAPARLLDGRDLRPTLDLRAVFKGLARDHLGLSPRDLEQVFPDSQRVKPLDRLV